MTRDRMTPARGRSVRRRPGPWAGAALLLAVGLLAGCPSSRRERPPGERPASVVRGTPGDCLGSPDAGTTLVRFAVLGDFGQAGPNEARVAELVRGWHPDFVITVGDNNYPTGAAETIDENIGQYFHDLIAPYAGKFGAGAAENRFFPSLGNHDWLTAGAEPYLAYFSLPGNERYYDFVRGNVHLFALDSDSNEPDGVSADSAQGRWLQSGLAAATETWRIVYLHHPPFSSGPHGSTDYMQWPFRKWGATLVLAGHDHDYERIEEGGMTYVVCGLGGAPPYQFGPALPGTRARFEGGFGAGLVEVGPDHLRFRFHTVDGALMDQTCLTAGT